jgi:tRNA G18 (ribose-2'-O)-methylase SpoU
MGVQSNRLRGYFAVGAERISKPLNLGNLMRSAHAFGASFVFTVAAHHKISAQASTISKSDTSKTFEHIPYLVRFISNGATRTMRTGRCGIN